MTPQTLSAQHVRDLLTTLKSRFHAHEYRHADMDWNAVQDRLDAMPSKVRSLYEMERTGGEPDVVRLETSSHSIVFVDCALQTPAGRVSLCYDLAALNARKEHKPKGSAMEMAASMGINMLTEDEYLALQKFEKFDTKRSCWLKTPEDMRALGGALFGECRYHRVFIGCNGAESYYSGRGFRGALTL